MISQYFLSPSDELYSTLPIDAESFRLVDLEPGIYNDDITCSMRLAQYSDPSACEFTALSYTWDHSPKKHSISLNGYQVMVHSNLQSFLRHYRSMTSVKTIWVDALCIDQESVTEKNEQIPLINLLYFFAENLVVWLGPESVDSSVAMERLGELGSGSIYEKMPYLSHDDVSAIQNLLNRGWWSRAWIVQEVALGALSWKVHAMQVMCGRDALPWTNLVLAAARMKAYQSDMRQYFPSIDHILDLDSLRDNAVDRIRDPFTMDQVIHLLTYYRRFRATDPRDKLYALGHMFSATHPQGIRPPPPDYDASVAKVYTDFAAFALENGGILELLRHCGARHHKVPSWVPDWSVSNTALPLPLTNSLKYDDVPWWAEPIEDPSTRIVSYKARAMSHDPVKARHLRDQRIQVLELDATGSGLVTDVNEIPSKLASSKKLPQESNSVFEDDPKAGMLVSSITGESSLPSHSEFRVGSYDCVKEGERVTEKETKKRLVKQLRDWKAPFQASGTSQVQAVMNKEDNSLLMDGMLFDTIECAHNGFVNDVEANWCDATRFMVQVGQCKAMALEKLQSHSPYSTEEEEHKSFWLTLFVGQRGEVASFGGTENDNGEKSSNKLRFQEWLPKIPQHWKHIEPAVTVTTNGALEAAWNSRVWQQIVADQPGEAESPGNWSFTSEMPYINEMMRPSHWNEMKLEQMTKEFREMAAMWKEQPFDLYHRPFNLLNVVPDPYSNVRREEDPMALRLTQRYNNAPLISFPVLNDDDKSLFDDDGKLLAEVAEIRRKYTPELQNRLRDLGEEANTRHVNVVPQGTLEIGLEKHALGRKFYVTKKGYFGLGPKELRTGDKVAVLMGLSVPFVIRKSLNPDRSGWELIGETYVHGIMGGEVIEQCSKGEIEKHTLKIV